jgi:hypothetical protein|tara:strand:+ start:838 stop:1038 length:201 start_codon:yes stop_codon:yes gene_type:complete
MIEDKAHTHASKNDKVGIVGESHIWDGPLDQEGRMHGEGSSNGRKGMKLKLAPCSYSPGPITSKAQ